MNEIRTTFQRQQATSFQLIFILSQMSHQTISLKSRLLLGFRDFDEDRHFHFSPSIVERQSSQKSATQAACAEEEENHYQNRDTIQ